MTEVSFRPSEEYAGITEKIFQEQRRIILGKLPFADIQHVAGTSIPGLITKGDIDVNVRVRENEFEDAVGVLKSLYEINQPENWTSSYASFKDDRNLGADFGIQLTIIGSPNDFFVRHRDLLLNNSKLVEELNALKKEYGGKSMDEYRKEKGRFFDKLNRP
ncbi:MAG: hypothetical protein A2Y84_00305 [Candidatus Colwellbacteria bacterium RBG_13_48_8]|uniref:GrpB family protein n=1 Tax=Candidatus Colwellbacteria bacterium RBG_13_48_8 TaxID=1797685 RepID=A0A1G1YXV6_9BACT|nr:MAG: hypothetical protein A2Y84_00305 [Candidatus Colwellbacteria bacterium RBG_13_48_8]